MIKRAEINKKFLLSLYLIGALLLSIVVIDGLFLNQAIKEKIIQDSNSLFFLSTILVLPHIMASNITLADEKYLKFYKIPLLKAAFIGIFVAIISPKIFGSEITFLIISIFTMQHVITQQFGILKSIFSFKVDNNFIKWQKYSIISAILIYLEIYRAGNLPEGYESLIQPLLHFFIFLSMLYSYKLLKQALAQKIDKLSLYYFIANAALILLAYFFVMSGYPLFAFLLPRAIHDLSAFAIYIAHDKNRNCEKNPPNFIYKITNFFGLPIAFSCMFLSFFFSYLVYLPSNAILVAQIITFTTFFHYYIEGIIWKRDGLHRKYVKFA